MHPDFKKIMMMRRADEIQQLVIAKAPSHEIAEVLNNYKSDVKTYHIVDPAVLKYCTTELQRTAIVANMEDRINILRTLQDLHST